MVISRQQQRSEIKRVAVLAVLTLGWSGCATLSELMPQEQQEQVAQPQERVEWPAEETQANEVEAAPPISPAQESAPPAALPSKLVEEVKARESRPTESRTPLKETLLAALTSSKPEKQPQKYVVKSGDALGTIADRNHVTLTMIKFANKLKTSRIHTGQKLIIPAAALRIEIDKSENVLREIGRAHV